MKLYDFTLSGHAHRVRLMLSLLGIVVEIIPVDLERGEHNSPEFLRFNPFGQVPVLDDEGLVITDSTAILVYLAKKYASGRWLPEDAAGAAQVQRWLSVASGEIAYGAAAARAINVFGARFDAAEAIARADALLRVMDAKLNDRDWIAADHITIADVALYSYVARAPEGNVDRFCYPNVTGWLKRVEALPGFHAFPKTPVGIPDTG